MLHEAATRVGSTVHGRYRLTALLSQGPLTTVYAGERVGLDRKVIVKYLSAELARQPHLCKRFEIEAHVLGRLNHPHCVPVFDFGVDGAPFVVMDFVPGESLRALLARGPLPPRRAVAIAGQVLNALIHAEGQGVRTMGITEAEVFVEAVGGRDHVRVLDGGLGLRMEKLAPTTGDECSDGFAVGELLGEMLVGRTRATAEVHAGGPPPLPVEARREHFAFSPALAAFLARARAQNPAERFPSLAGMGKALAEVPEAGVEPVRSAAGFPWAALAAGAARLGFKLVRAGWGLRRLLLRWGRKRPSFATLSPETRRIVLLATGAFVGAFGVVFALVKPPQPPVAAPAALAVAAERHRKAETPVLASAVPSPVPAPAGPAPTSEAELAVELADAAFSEGRFDDGLGYFRFAIRRDRLVRGNAVLVDHVIEGLAHERQATRAEDFLRQLGKDARPHLSSAARNHADARVRKRAAALLSKGARRPFLRWVWQKG